MTAKQMGIERKEELPVVELFKDKTRREILQYVLDELDGEEWTTKGEITDNISVGRESVRKKFQPLILYGILDVSDPDANIPQYTLADTRVVGMLEEWDGYSLFELFGSLGRQKLVDFFLTQADPNESYSMTALSKESAASYASVDKHIDALVNAGLVEEVEGARSTEYQVNQDSEIYHFLRDLNEMLYRTYNERSSH